MLITVQRISVALTIVVSLVSSLEAKELNLETNQQWRLENVNVASAEYQGKKSIRVNAKQLSGERGGEHLAILKDIEFRNGTLELELAGKPLSTAGGMARGFIGVAFRVQKDDPSSYEAFYLRPTNGRAEDQLRRNHSVQYISHPAHTWHSLRKNSPGKYESYADLVPGEWTKVKVVVNGTDARLFVGAAQQPCLIVKDLKHGERSGAIGLWIHPSTDAYFRNLRVSDDSLAGVTSEQMVGSWKYVWAMKDGEKLDADHFGNQSVEITQDTLTLNSESKFVMKFKLDTKKSPTGIDLEITEAPFGTGSTAGGVVNLKDGKLYVCYAPMGGDPPSKLDAPEGSGHYMFVLEKKIGRGDCIARALYWDEPFGRCVGPVVSFKNHG